MIKLKRVLVVEDDRFDLELMVTTLTEHNLANGIDVVHDGAEALDYLWRRGSFANREEGNPAVILLDLKLPKVNGLEVLKQVKADPKLKYIPTVILTSSREEQDVIAGYDLGANAYVVKPVEFASFTRAIRDLGSFWAILNEVPPLR